MCVSAASTGGEPCLAGRRRHSCLQVARCAVTLLIAAAGPGASEAGEPTICPGGDWVVVDAEAPTSEAICEGAIAATEYFEACGISLPGAATIRVVDHLPLVCDRPAHATFDPGIDEITIATPRACLASVVPGDVFDRVGAMAAYRSVVAHEAAHLILHRSGVGPERFLEHEYIAAAFQVSNLSAEQRDALLADFGIEAPVGDAKINAAMYWFDPLRFAAKAYLHFRSQEDTCEYLRAIVAGEERLSRVPA